MNRAALLAGGLVLGGFTPAVAAQSVHYEGGVSVASGDYIYAERTTSWVFTNGLALSAGPLTVRALLPVFRQNSVVLAVSAAGPIPTGDGAGVAPVGSDGGRSGGKGSSPQVVGSFQLAADGDPDPAESDDIVTSLSDYAVALGDPTASVTVQLYRGSAAGISATVGAKAPVTGTGFGTGRWDYGGSVSLSHRLGFAGLVALDVGYWRLGDLPDLELRDPVLGSLSVAYLTRGGWGLGLSASAASPVIAGYPGSAQAGLSISKVGGGGTLGVNLAAGLTDTAPDLAVGLMWRVALRRASW